MWALGLVVGYASANIFDKLAVDQAVDQRIGLLGPLLRGSPSLALGIFLVAKNRTLGEMIPGSPQYVGRRAILSFVGAGVLSTLGLFAYYLAVKIGRRDRDYAGAGNLRHLGHSDRLVFSGRALPRLCPRRYLLIFLGLLLLSFGEFRAAGMLTGRGMSSYWYWEDFASLFTALTYGVFGVRGEMATPGRASVHRHPPAVLEERTGRAGRPPGDGLVRNAGKRSQVRPGRGFAAQRSALRDSRRLLHFHRAAPDGGGVRLRGFLVDSHCCHTLRSLFSSLST